MVKNILFLLLITLMTNSKSFSQEMDDMYFVKKDRTVKKVKKSSPAEIILSKYKLGNTRTNSNENIDSDILKKYKVSSSITKNLSKRSNLPFNSLKFNRDNLYKSLSFNRSFMDLDLFLMYGRISPNYMYYVDPFDPFSFGYNHGYIQNRWFPRSLFGMRMLSIYNPHLFFSNPYLSSYYPLMSPSLANIHYGGYASSGWMYYPSWIWTNNGTGMGLQHTSWNNHKYVSGITKKNSDVVIGPRGGRNEISNNNVDLVSDRYSGRRKSGITNQIIQKNNENILDQTQNTYLKNDNLNRENFITRSNRQNSILNSNRRSDNIVRNYERSKSYIRDSFSYNNLRSEKSTYSSADGRRTSYSVPDSYKNNNYQNSNRFSNDSRSSFNNSSAKSFSNSNSGSSFSTNNTSSRGSSGSTMSSGSSGGSSRGKN